MLPFGTELFNNKKLFAIITIDPKQFLFIRKHDFNRHFGHLSYEELTLPNALLLNKVSYKKVNEFLIEENSFNNIVNKKN